MWLDKLLFCVAFVICIALQTPAHATSIVLTVEGRYTFTDRDRTDGNHWTIDIRHHDGRLQGQVVRIVDARGLEKVPLCTHCTGAERDRPVLGMTVIRDVNVVMGDAQWRGTWFDVATGQSTSMLLGVGVQQVLTLRVCRGIVCKNYALRRTS